MKRRGYRSEDQKTLAKLGTMAFGGSVAGWKEYFDPEKNPRLDPEQVHVIEEDGEVRVSVTVLPMEVFVSGEPHPMGGVAAVMAHPAYRRRGYAGELMRAALRDMREREVHLSMLDPFAHAFYRSYGYELATEAIEYTLKPTDLPTSPEQSHLRAYREGDLPEMMSLLESEAAEHPICVRRSEGRWRQLLGSSSREPNVNDNAVAVYERDGVDGYLIYKMSGWREGRTPPRELKVLEMVARTPEAREGLISFMGALDPLVFEIKYWTSRGEPLHPYLRSSYVTAKVAPDQMLRLVDVQGALNYLNSTVEEPLVLEVADDVIPENAGEYTIGGGKVLRGADARERVSLDVRQLAQLYAGYLPTRQLARHGLIEVSSPEALELLEAYFPVGDSWVFGLDHF